jgi:hypothetical protein
MTGGGITWNRSEIGPCRFAYFTLPVNLAEVCQASLEMSPLLAATSIHAGSGYAASS